MAAKQPHNKFSFTNLQSFKPLSNFPFSQKSKRIVGYGLIPIETTPPSFLLILTWESV